MDLITVLFWFMYLVVKNPIAADEAYEMTTGTTTKTTTINTVDVIENQLNRILVQFCASEIDRNKTTSAILKLGQLADPKASIGNVVEFYIENYEESFDNLLHFIDHISSFELQQIAYNKLIETIKLNQINVINLLSFENFVRNKLELSVGDESIERKIYENLLLILGSHVKELIVSMNLNRVMTLINNSTNPDRIFELIPTIVKGIDLNNFTDVDRIFEFSMQLPNENQIKLIGKVLSEMQEKNQYKHVFHFIGLIRMLRHSINQGDEGWTLENCLLSEVGNLVPPKLQQLLSQYSEWQIKSFDSDHELLSYSDPNTQNSLLVNSHETYRTWRFHFQNCKTVTISSISWGSLGGSLSIDYCFHNDSFPVLKKYDYEDLTQISWYLLMSDDLTYFQIKNIFTNELLLVEDMRTADGRRVALSAQCSDCDASKWSLSLEDGRYSPTSSDCRNPK